MRQHTSAKNPISGKSEVVSTRAVKALPGMDSRSDSSLKPGRLGWFNQKPRLARFDRWKRPRRRSTGPGIRVEQNSIATTKTGLLRCKPSKEVKATIGVGRRRRVGGISTTKMGLVQ
jgi:hypothetical protein